ncbi:MAG: hypothetical protein ACI3XP_07970 [Eubacteriales bacterium]
MRWGRSSRRSGAYTEKKSPSGAARAVMIAGSLACTVFFCAAVTGTGAPPECPPALAQAALGAFQREHAALSAVLGIDERFPEDAVYAGTFGNRGDERYREYVTDTRSFGDCMREALEMLLGVDR